MARFFREQDIDEFRDCFYLNARSGQIRSLDELTIIMRSLGMSPTITELKKYFKEKRWAENYFFVLQTVNGKIEIQGLIDFYLRFKKSFLHMMTGKDGKISFADMLEIMHNHSQKENIPQEILRAFRASDKTKSGRIPARELRHILLLWGEKLSPKEVDRIFREANVSPNGYVNYDDFVRVVCAPVPDYY